MPPKKPTGRGTGDSRVRQPRMKHTRVKTARGRKAGSTRWLQRQFNDPYVVQAEADGYRSRAAYKLLELHEKFGLLKPGMRVVDLGAAPGGWTQVAIDLTRAEEDDDTVVVAVDRLEMHPLEGATVLTLDFLDDDAPDKIRDAIDGRADIVLSDMAPSFTGHRQTDVLQTLNLAEMALDLAHDILQPGGVFVAKLLQGAGDELFIKQLRSEFESVRFAKPPASRSESAERYVVAVGYAP